MIASQSDSSLGERGSMMVDLVSRYRVVTLALLSVFFPTEGADALRMLLSRLVTAGWLSKYPVGNREQYYTLGPRAYRNLATVGTRPHRKWQGFGQEGLIQHLAIGFLCARRGMLRLRAEEFVQYFPGHNRPGLPAQNYLLRTDGTDETLYWAIVDHATSPNRFPSKIGRAVASRFALPAFQERILAGGFAVAVLTGTEAKARRIEAAIAEDRSPHAEAGVIVVPDIESLLFL